MSEKRKAVNEGLREIIGEKGFIIIDMLANLSALISVLNNSDVSDLKYGGLIINDTTETDALVLRCDKKETMTKIKEGFSRQKFPVVTYLVLKSGVEITSYEEIEASEERQIRNEFEEALSDFATIISETQNSFGNASNGGVETLSISIEKIKEITDALIKKYPKVKKIIPQTHVIAFLKSKEFHYQVILEKVKGVWKRSDGYHENTHVIKKEIAEIEQQLKHSTKRIDNVLIELLDCLKESKGEESKEILLNIMNSDYICVADVVSKREHREFFVKLMGPIMDIFKEKAEC